MLRPASFFKAIPALFSLFSSMSASAYIGGSPVADELPATVKVATFQSSCTGVKVGENKILIAAHCALVQRQVITVSREDGSDMGLQKIGTSVASFTLHPSFEIRQNGEPYGIDLAILETAEPLTGIPNALIDLKPVVAGDSLFVGGYGCKGPQLSKKSFLTAAKKSAIDSAYAFLFEVGMLDDDGVTKSMGCHGDSGGPAYRLNENGKAFVVGINSATNAPEPAFTVDATTGKILRFAMPEAEAQMRFRITRVGYGDSDPFGVVSWLKTHLSNTAFIKTN